MRAKERLNQLYQDAPEQKAQGFIISDDFLEFLSLGGSAHRAAKYERRKSWRNWGYYVLYPRRERVALVMVKDVARARRAQTTQVKMFDAQERAAFRYRLIDGNAIDKNKSNRTRAIRAWLNDNPHLAIYLYDKKPTYLVIEREVLYGLPNLAAVNMPRET